MEPLENLNDLFAHELRDLYDAEQQLTKALPLLASAATSDQLRQAFEEHLEETKEQARTLEKILQRPGESAEGKPCKAMAGFVAEARETLDIDADPDVLDAAFIVAAQKVEPYEIAGYGSVRTFHPFAELLGSRSAVGNNAEGGIPHRRTTETAGLGLNKKAETADQSNA